MRCSAGRALCKDVNRGERVVGAGHRRPQAHGAELGRPPARPPPSQRPQRAALWRRPFAAALLRIHFPIKAAGLVPAPSALCLHADLRCGSCINPVRTMYAGGNDRPRCWGQRGLPFSSRPRTPVGCTDDRLPSAGVLRSTRLQLGDFMERACPGPVWNRNCLHVICRDTGSMLKY